MQYTNEWIERGRTEGLTKGREEGRREVLLLQLRRRLGSLPAEFIDRMDHLSVSQLDDLADALLDFQTLADAQSWLASLT
jgi:predicted transposase YdaD